MSKPNMTISKRDREKRKQKEKKEKQERKAERKQNKAKSPDDMIAYVDEFGQLSATPPPQRQEVNAEDIDINVPKRTSETPEERIRTGKLAFYDDAKGYGFINDLATQERIFVHSSAFLVPLRQGDRVSYEVDRGPKGFFAVNVRLADQEGIA